MNTRLVRREVVWAVLGMETAVALPLMSIVAEGSGASRLAMTILFALLLPLGYIALRLFDPLRDPAWRVLAGFVLVVLLRLPSTLVPGEGAAAAMARFLQAVLPATLLFGVWWRGGALAEVELTAPDVHLEFLVGSGGLLVLLIVFHGLVPAEPELLALTVGLFATSGLLSAVFARQDAADATSLGGGRMLGTLVGLIPALASFIVMLWVRPGALTAFWTGLARLLELMLIPLSLLLGWLASLLPAPSPGTMPPMPPQPRPDPRALDTLLNGHQLPDWIAWTALLLVFLLVVFLIMGMVRMLLESGLAARTKYERAERPHAVTFEHAGDARGDMRRALRWLLHWLRGRAQHAPGAARQGGAAQDGLTDARSAYRSLLHWASEHGLARRPAETTHQLQDRIASRVPEAEAMVDTLTSAYEVERYGERQQPDERLRRLQQALHGLASLERE
jgi:hypothetical protein